MFFVLLILWTFIVYYYPIEKDYKKDYMVKDYIDEYNGFSRFVFKFGEIMTDCTTAHAGIELDALDLSRINQESSLPGMSKLNLKKIDPKTFVKDLLKKTFENDVFSSFSVQIRDVNKILKMKYSSAGDIADVILKDMALTTKLLKLVNSSFYGQFSKKGISTISEAMIILGTEEIKLAAASLKIYELMQDISKTEILKKKALKSLQRSIIARQIAIDGGIGDDQVIQISAMLYDFGEYLVALFSPEAFINIEILAEEKSLTREQASKSVIGVSYSQIGRFVASKWNLPATIIQAMEPVTQFNVVKSRLTTGDLQRYCCSFSNELCNIELSIKGEYIGQGESIAQDEYIGKKVDAVSEKYKNCFEIPTSKSVKLLKMSWNKITKHASILTPGKNGKNPKTD